MKIIKIVIIGRSRFGVTDVSWYCAEVEPNVWAYNDNPFRFGMAVREGFVRGDVEELKRRLVKIPVSRWDGTDKATNNRITELETYEVSNEFIKIKYYTVADRLGLALAMARAGYDFERRRFTDSTDFSDWKQIDKILSKPEYQKVDLISWWFRIPDNMTSWEFKEKYLKVVSQ